MAVLSGRHWPNKQGGGVVFRSSNCVILFILLMFNIFFTPYRSTLCYAENGNLCCCYSNLVLYKFSCCVAVSHRRLQKQWWRTVYCCVGTLNIKKCRDCMETFHCDDKDIEWNPQDGHLTVILLWCGRTVLPNVFIFIFFYLIIKDVYLLFCINGSSFCVCARVFGSLPEPLCYVGRCMSWFSVTVHVLHTNFLEDVWQPES